MSSNIVWHGHSVSAQQRAELKQQKPVVLWFTGLSGAGKSTIANALEKLLLDRHHHSYLLDGDNIRHGLNKDLGFSATDRAENIRRVGEVCKLLVDAGLIVLSAFVSPYRADRQRLRESLQQGEFVEIFIDTPLATCEQRDPKGLYQQARTGDITNMTGVNAPYEQPERPEIHINTLAVSSEQAAQQIISYLQQHQYIDF